MIRSRSTPFTRAATNRSPSSRVMIEQHRHDLRVEGDVDERPPLRTLRFADQSHAGLMRQPVAFARVAGNARADDVFPGGGAAAVARDHVVEVLSRSAAVLACADIAGEHGSPRAGGVRGGVGDHPNHSLGDAGMPLTPVLDGLSAAAGSASVVLTEKAAH